MEDSIGLVVGKIIGYYEDQPIAYDESNIQPLVKFLLRGDYSLIGIEKSGKKSWELKYEGENNTDDVTVLQKVLITRGYLTWPTDASGSLLPFGTFDTVTRNAVMKYQVFNGMIPRGIVDKFTWSSLFVPWDDLNEKPQRSNYNYNMYLYQSEYVLVPPSAILQQLAEGQKVAVKDKIRIIADGTNCGYMLLYINDQFITSQKGNYFEYNYTIPSIGNYSIEIRASNMPSPYGTEYAVSNILSFTAVTAETWYDTIKDIEELTSGYHEFFVKELESKVYVYITDPAKEKITFSIGKLNKHETVSEIVDASGLKPIVAMNAGFFDMCVYYDENYPEWGKKKGEMRIDNNDVEQHGVLIINGEELETVSMKRWVDVEEDEATKKRMKYLKKKRYTKKE